MTAPPELDRDPVRNASVRSEFERLVRDAWPHLVRAANRVAYPDRDLADDLVQSAIVKGYQAAMEGNLHLNRSAIAWMCGAITFEAMAYAKKHRRVQSSSTDDHLLRVPCPAQSPEAQVMALQTSLELAEVCAQLPPEQRQCIELVDFAEYSYAEAAELMNVPIGTVRSRLSRARLFVASRLRETLLP